MLGGWLTETEKKRICQTSALKTGCSRLRNLSTGHLRESPSNSIWLSNKVVKLFTKWLLMGGGHLWEVVVMRELTVLPVHIGFEQVKKIQPIKYIITCNEAQDKAEIFCKTLISHFNWVSLHYGSNGFLHDIWFQFLQEGIIAHINNCWIYLCS